MNFTVALLQMRGCGFDQAANRAKGDAFCRRARKQGADLALFPEMWNIGYTFFDATQPRARHDWQARALRADDSFVTHFRALARELNMAIALTYLQKWRSAPRNVVTLIDRRGEILFTYAKVHTCEFDKEAALTPGEEFFVADLETARGAVKIGAMICYDREFPESARVLMLNGAEIILTPNACDLENNRLSQYRARAFENMVGLAMTNYAAPDQNGNSIAFDGIAFDRAEHSREMKLVQADARDDVFLARFDLDALRAYRARETWGNAYRQPRAYRALINSRVRAPFVRARAR
ncbi:MAG: carbon-nitrogen hydrolase family protein [Chloroflexi bacterium]|nr:carbon-nitrogen hydrolase family protein [Chloroflexota bacterium]